MTDKYSDKPLALRFFHRYTGFICAGIFLVIMFVLWTSYTSGMYFFDSWNCQDIFYMATSGERHETLTEDEHLRLHEIIDECIRNDSFHDFEH